MKFRSLLFLSLMPSLAAAEMYTVKRGDSLWALAQEHDLSPGLIKKINDLSKEQLYPGQRLFLPTDIITYSARKGDTLESIAQKHGTELSYLVILNNLEDDMLAEGQALKVPKAALVKTGRTHVVSRGENLGGVALKYGMSLNRLKELNNKKDNRIFTGERLILEEDFQEKAPSKPLISVETNIRRHPVKANETLGGIALRYKVPQRDLMAWNNKKNAAVYKGESLKILNFSTNTPQNRQPSAKITEEDYQTVTYTVKRGDNLTSVARKFKVSINSLKEWNGKRNGSIYINEKLKIRAPKDMEPEAPQNSTYVYVVRKGDTMDSVASKLKTTRSALMAANRKKETRIYIGEKLKIRAPESSRLAIVRGARAPAEVKAPLQGIRSPRFTGIPLPVAYSELKTAAPSGRGVDIYLKSQTSLKAPSSAVVEYAGYITALQNVVILKLSEDRTLIYAGLENIYVQAGQEVNKGEALGQAGYSALDNSAKIYMEIRDKTQVANAFYTYKDLEKYIKK